MSLEPDSPAFPAPRARLFRTTASRDLAQRPPADLEPILREFAAAGAAAAQAETAPPRIIRPGRERRGLRAASLGAVVAASLAGLSAGALVGRPALLFGSHAAASANRGAAAAPALAPIPAVDSPSGDAVARLVPAPEIPAETLAPRIAASAPAAAPAARRIPVRARPAPAPARPHVPKTRIASAAHRRGDVVAADRALRRAYARAIRAGASHEVLVAYRDRWEDLREQARFDPRGAAGGYWRLSERLDRVSDRVATAGPAAEPPPTHSLFRKLHLW
jgi:hypothetical protein